MGLAILADGGLAEGIFRYGVNCEFNCLMLGLVYLVPSTGAKGDIKYSSIADYLSEKSHLQLPRSITCRYSSCNSSPTNKHLPPEPDKAANHEDGRLTLVSNPDTQFNEGDIERGSWDGGWVESWCPKRPVSRHPSILRYQGARYTCWLATRWWSRPRAKQRWPLRFLPARHAHG